MEVPTNCIDLYLRLMSVLFSNFYNQNPLSDGNNRMDDGLALRDVYKQRRGLIYAYDRLHNPGLQVLTMC